MKSRNGWVRRYGRFLRNLPAVGYREGRRRLREAREDGEVEAELSAGIHMTDRERKRMRHEKISHALRFVVIPWPGENPAEGLRALRDSLEQQTWEAWSWGSTPLPRDPKVYIVFAEKDGFLHPQALRLLARRIEETGAELLYTDEDYYEGELPEGLSRPFCKPDYGPVTFRNCNVIGPFWAASSELIARAGAENLPDLAGECRWEALTGLAEKANRVEHVARVLYWRRIPRGGEIPEPEMRRETEPLRERPLVSILIPNKDHREDLLRCVDSIRRSTYENYEILILENNSGEEETFRCYRALEQGGDLRVIPREGPFNYSAVNNLGAREARGEMLLLLNNDTEVLNGDWMEEMLRYALRDDVGAVGAKLYYPDGTIQHGGIGIGIKMLAGHYHRGFAGDSHGYFGRLCHAQNVSAVTGACMMIPRKVYENLGGMDESFPLVFNDIDLCLRMREKGLQIVWTPWAELTHYESKSRGPDEDTPEKKAFFIRETNRFLRRWTGALAAGDPYYNRNLTRWAEDFSLRRIARTE